MNNEMDRIKNSIINGRTALGIELGSTRIKAILLDESNMPVASAAMNGKTVILTVYGLTVWMKFGQVSRTAIKNG